jgi:hypothetical protein
MAKIVISIGDGGLRAVYTDIPDLTVYTVDSDWDDGAVISGPFGGPKNNFGLVGPLKNVVELDEELDASQIKALADPDNRDIFRGE